MRAGEGARTLNCTRNYLRAQVYVYTGMRAEDENSVVLAENKSFKALRLKTRKGIARSVLKANTEYKTAASFREIAFLMHERKGGRKKTIFAGSNEPRAAIDLLTI